MNDEEFDDAVLAAGFEAIAREGWCRASLTAAAREAGLDLARLRRRFPHRLALLARLGTAADTAALAELEPGASVQEALFAALMRRIDLLQRHRAGVLAVLAALPADPLAASYLWQATGRSLDWMLEAAGLPTRGVAGLLARAGLTGVWLYALHAWRGDQTADLSHTMAALDAALTRAAMLARSVPGGMGQGSAAERETDAPHPAAPEPTNPAGES